MDYTRLIQEMESILQVCETPELKEFSFRSRIRHTHRVMKWADRLLQSETADYEVVMCACIFHDIGYAKTAPHGTNHAEHSVTLLQERLELLTPYLSDEQIASVLHCIRYHSRKEWLRSMPSVAKPAALTPELIIMMEADLLDECGPLALIWDAMAEGQLPDSSFLRTYERMCESAPPYTEEEPCRTPTARRYWKQQQEVHIRFLESYKKDLGLDLDPSWKAPYKDLFSYMLTCMEKQDLVPNRNGIIFPFRQRSLHMERVAGWAYRLAAGYPSLNLDLLMAAAILHDIGYSVDTDGITHAHSSVPLVRSYLESHSIPESDISFICDRIAAHSDKSCLERDDNDLFFQLLIEADHLDETGAMSLSWDAMASMNPAAAAKAGTSSEEAFEPSYTNTAAHIARYTLKMLRESPMKTPEGIRIWQEKQQLVSDFYNLLQLNLEEFP